MMIWLDLDIDHGHVGDLGHEDALHLADLYDSALVVGRYQVECGHGLDGELVVVDCDQAGGGAGPSQQ